MSKIDELIEKLCPNGVKKYILKDICDVYDGTHQTPKYTNSGIKFASVENIKDIYATNKYILEEDYNKYKIKTKRNDVLMTRIGKIGECAVIESDEPMAYYVSLALLRPKQDILNSKFLKYYIESIHGSKEIYKRTLVNAVPIKINMGDIGKISIAVPPLEVQCEIVHFLDNFTLLSAELSAELKAREKQYDFYRRNLLTFENTNTSFIELKDLFNTKNGYTPSKSNKEYWEDGTISWYRMEDIRENGRILSNSIQKVNKKGIKGNLFPKNSIIISTSATIGEHALITEDFLCNQRFTCLTLKDCYKNNFDIKFLFYYCYLLSEWCLNNLNQGNFASVDMKLFNKFKFPIIDIDKQKKIVNMLEKLDKLCNDISEGLPAEIEARQKQYEYYRDKLLTFKELGNE